MAEEILRIVNIAKRLAGITAPDQVQLSCSEGEVCVLAGENRAGRNTILKILVGIHQADEGEIYFYGRKVEIRNPGQSQKLGIAMVLRELTLVGEMTIQENIYLDQEPVIHLGRVNRRGIKKCIPDVMDRYEIHIDPDAIVDSLPVAGQQMAEILRILAKDPELIILDEPTSALAGKEVKQLYQTIHNLIADGKTIIFIFYRLEELFELGHRVIIFKDGCYIGTRSMNEINEDGLIHMMMGRSLNHVFPPSICQVGHGQIIFEVKNLADVGHKLSHVSFQVYEGKILGVTGPQEHGQTELLNTVNGLYPLSEGEIVINGKRVGVKNTGQAIADGIALVPFDRKNQDLMLELSNHHNLPISGMEKRMKGYSIDKKAEQAFSEPMMLRLSIKMGELDLSVSSLSGGNQQKVVPGEELTVKPRVILSDESTRGIDAEVGRKFYQIICGLVAQGMAVTVNSSGMLEIIGMSSQMIVIYERRISGTLEEEGLTEERVMQLGMGLGNNREVRKGEEQGE